VTSINENSYYNRKGICMTDYNELQKQPDLKSSLDEQDEKDIIRYVTQKFTDFKEARRTKEKKWNECIRAFLSKHDSVAESGQKWHSNIYVPLSYEAATNIYSMLKSTIFPTDSAFFSVDCYTPGVKVQGDIIKSLLLNQLDEINFITRFGAFLKQLVIIGNSAAAVYWKKTSRIEKENQNTSSDRTHKSPPGYDVERLIYDGPVFETINMYDIVFDPSIPRWQEGLVIHRNYRTLEEIRNNKTYKNTDNLQACFTNQEDTYKIDASKAFETGYSNDNKKMIKLYSAYGDFRLNGRIYYNYIAVVANEKFLIRFEPNPYHEKPFIFSTYESVPNEVYGIGALEPALGIQYQVNSFTNQKADVMSLILNGMWAYVEDGIFDPEEMIAKPGALIPVRDVKNLKPLHPDSSVALSFEEIAQLKAEFQQITGASKYFTGVADLDIRKTATEVQALQQAGFTRFSEVIQNIEETALKRTILLIYQYNKSFTDKNLTLTVTNEGQEYKINPAILYQDQYNFRITAANSSLSKELRITKLIEFIKLAITLPQVASSINMNLLLEKLYNEFGFNINSLIKCLAPTPEILAIIPSLENKAQKEKSGNKPLMPYKIKYSSAGKRGKCYLEEEARQAIEKCFDYFNIYRGQTKPNAATSQGIPYHIYEDQWQWLISPTATTSECLTLFLRACVACKKYDYAQNIATFILNNLFYDTHNVPHWLIDLAGGTEMESTKHGAFDNAIFTFTDGVTTIPATPQNMGDRITDIRGCFTTDTTFAYSDYYIKPRSGSTEKEINNYIVSEAGCLITLSDTTFNGDLQVYYAYHNGTVLDANDKYRSYPRPAMCILAPDNYQISVATDGGQWAARAFKEYGKAVNNISFITKGDDILEQLNNDMLVATDSKYLFNARNRGEVWFNVSTYDENSCRNSTFTMTDKEHLRFSFDADPAAGAVSWSIGKEFNWPSDKNMDIKVKGDGNNIIRQFVIRDSRDKEFYYSWLDDSTEDKTYSMSQNDFVALEHTFLDACRVPYNTPYITKDPASIATYSLDNYNSSYEDSNGITYPLWHKFDYTHSGAGGWVIFGAGKPIGINSSPEGQLELVLAANSEKNITVKIIDNNDTEFTKTNVNIGLTPEHIIITWAEFGTVAHPVKDIQLVMPENDSGSLYWGAALIDNRLIFNDTTGKLLKFETRQATSGYFEVVYARNYVDETIADAYLYAGVPVFSLEYTELGLMGWRAGSYTGYTNPFCWIDKENLYENNYSVAVQFLKDAQNKYLTDFSTIGPFYPNYLRNLQENEVYGVLETWTFDGPDPNTTWAGFQYRALVNLAEYYFFRKYNGDQTIDLTAQAVLNNWVTFLQSYMNTHD
jgi:hypothetical protein